MRRSRGQESRSRRGEAGASRTADSPRSHGWAGTVLPLALVAGAALFATAPALRNGLFWDDAIVLSRPVAAMGSPLGAFFPPPGLPQFIPSYYRPVVFLSLLLDRALWGSRLVGFHLNVWLLHGLTAAIVFLLMRAVIPDRQGEGSLRSQAGALVAGLAFAVHPVHAEAVAWIMGRADILAALFAGLALLAAARSSRPTPPGDPARSPVAAVAVALASALALLSKESAIVLPILAALVLVAVAAIGDRLPSVGTLRDILTTRSTLFAVGASGAGILLALGLRALAHAGQKPPPPSGSALSTSDALARLPGALVFALGRLAWPWPDRKSTRLNSSHLGISYA